MQGEDAFDAYAEADATHGESGAGSAALLRDDHTFKSLQTFFFLLAFTFLEADVHADGVARAALGAGCGAVRDHLPHFPPSHTVRRHVIGRANVETPVS